MTGADIIRKLSDHLYEEPCRLPGFTGQKAVWGEHLGARFIATLDYDGQLELSLSVEGPGKIDPFHATMFFNWLGVRPAGQREESPSASVWVVVQGRRQ